VWIHVARTSDVHAYDRFELPYKRDVAPDDVKVHRAMCVRSLSTVELTFARRITATLHINVREHQ